ncbi:hypothetical protein LCGC14_2724430 [marine sediment metagenome]|uniref:Uncharacterized protein n=1 Tax=marine sediment metagenome TaxID=412755 RepID=A0A0F8ZWL1_9ZZZZ
MEPDEERKDEDEDEDENERPDWVDPTIYTCQFCGTRIDGSEGSCKPCRIIALILLIAVVVCVIGSVVPIIWAGG